MADNEAKGGAGGAANSERPKRDAAKKFLNGADGPNVKVDGRKVQANDAMGARAQATARKGKGPDAHAGKRSSTGGGAEGEKKRPRTSQDMHHSDLPKVSVDSGIRRLDLAALKRYKKHFNLKNPTNSSKDDLQTAVIRHFASQLRADSGKTERSFLKFLKDRKSSDKQD